MGASGSAWIKHTKQPGLRADAIIDVPHPRSVRAGQRYFPIAGNRARNSVPLRVVRAIGPLCDLRREDDGRNVRLRTARLLELDGSGAGRYYRFLGYAPRRAYATGAVVVGLDAPWARIICPEWNPRLEITVAAAMLPAALRVRGAWVGCKADLSADEPARVRPHAFALPDRHFDPTLYGDLDLPPAPAAVAEATAAESGEGCGDIVLFLGEEELDTAMVGGSGVYLVGHPPPVVAGARIYLHADGRVRGWRTLRSRRALPNGTRLVLDGPWHGIAIDAAPSRPASGVQHGQHGQQLWKWRSWRRAAERAEAGDPSASDGG